MPTKQIKKKFRNVKKNSKRKQKKNYSKNKRKMMNKRNKSRKKMRGGSAALGETLTDEDVDEINILFNEYLKGDEKHKMVKLDKLSMILEDTKIALYELVSFTNGNASDSNKLKKDGKSIQFYTVKKPHIKEYIQSEVYKLYNLLLKIGFEINKKKTKLIITGKDKEYKLDSIEQVKALIQKKRDQILAVNLQQEELKSVDWNLGNILRAQPQEMEAQALEFIPKWEWEFKVITQSPNK